MSLFEMTIQMVIIGHIHSIGAQLMKKYAVLVQLVVLGLIGCNGASTPVATPTPSSDAPASAEAPGGDQIAATYVSLKVPNMH